MCIIEVMIMLLCSHDTIIQWRKFKSKWPVTVISCQMWFSFHEHVHPTCISDIPEASRQIISSRGTIGVPDNMSWFYFAGEYLLKNYFMNIKI